MASKNLPLPVVLATDGNKYHQSYLNKEIKLKVPSTKIIASLSQGSKWHGCAWRGWNYFWSCSGASSGWMASSPFCSVWRSSGWMASCRSWRQVFIGSPLFWFVSSSHDSLSTLSFCVFMWIFVQKMKLKDAFDINKLFCLISAQKRQDWKRFVIGQVA